MTDTDSADGWCQVRAIRGATTVRQDSCTEVKSATRELLENILRLNNISQEDIISLYFSITQDIKSFNPAAAAREELNFNDVSMICGQEAFIEGSLPLCIRVMMHVSLPRERKIQHCYLRNAVSLRSDWANAK